MIVMNVVCEYGHYIDNALTVRIKLPLSLNLQNDIYLFQTTSCPRPMLTNAWVDALNKVVDLQGQA